MSVSKRLKTDTAFLAKFLVNPKDALANAGLDPETPAHKSEVKKLEIFLKIVHENIKTAGEVVEIGTPTLQWGLGASCCNSKTLIA